MPVKLIVNGYYRSGTTFLWDLLRNNLLEDYNVFYEPLNPHIAEYVHQEKVENKESRLHGKKLWREYNKLDFQKRKHLFLKHPNTDNLGIQSTDLLISYLDLFDAEPQNICLQTNRLHFHFSELKKVYNLKNIHLIRHPLDVFNSMKKASFLSENKLKTLLKKLFLSKTEFFQLDKEYEWINQKTGIPGKNIGSWRLRYNITLFEKFVIVYTISNYYALVDLKEETDLVISYEYLMTKSEDALEKVSNFLGSNVDKNTLSKFSARNLYNFEKRQVERLISVILKFDLVEEWKYIENVLNQDGITYVNVVE